MSNLSKKDKIISAIIGLILAVFGGGAIAVFGGGGGGQMVIGPMNVAGSATNAITMPIAYYAGVTTSTAGFALGEGGDIVQDINIDGINKGRISGIIVPSRSTSTLSIRPMISLDGTTFYPLIGTSTPTTNIATTSINIVPQVWTIRPSAAASTTFSFEFDIPAAKTLRLQYLSSDVTATDSGHIASQAYIQLSGEQGF